MKMVCWLKHGYLILGILVAAGSVSAEKLVLAESKDRLDFLDANHWKTGKLEGRQCLILHVPGRQKPPVRRPGEYALLKGGESIRGFTIEAASLEPDAKKNRDVCVLFGYQDDTHFYYAHVSSNSDNKFHNIIMRVDGDSRTRINLEKDPEPRLSNDWKTIRVRHSADGKIRVYVDDLAVPVMTAEDKTYPAGRVGFGTFDDRAAFTTFALD